MGRSCQPRGAPRTVLGGSQAGLGLFLAGMRGLSWLPSGSMEPLSCLHDPLCKCRGGPREPLRCFWSHFGALGTNFDHLCVLFGRLGKHGIMENIVFILVFHMSMFGKDGRPSDFSGMLL